MTLERWKTLVDQLVDLAVIPQAVAPEGCFAEVSGGEVSAAGSAD